MTDSPQAPGASAGRGPAFTRRNLLRAGVYGATAGLIPAPIRRALALPATVVNKDITDVAHVVILMQENRSFDHYLGTLPGVRGFGDRFTLPRANGESMLVQRNATRTVLPYYLDSSKGKALGVGNPHSWGDSQAAWDHGRMSHWPVAKTDTSMGYLKPADVPFHTALANTFTVCDEYHCSLHGGTNTNRIFHWTGTNRGPTARSNGQDYCLVNNDGWDNVAGTPQANSLTWTTYPERLQQAGVSWKTYQFLPDNYGDNPLSGFKAFRDSYSQANNGNLATYNGVSGVPAVEYSPAVHDTPGLPTYNPLYKGIGRTEPTYPDTLTQFRADAASDSLPAVSWIVGPTMYTEHPDYTPAQGAYFIGQVLDALTANPTVWGKTVFIVNYDENDGYFDHQPPPCPPSPDGQGGFAGKSTVATERDYMNVPNATDLSAGDGRPFGAGLRVPMFVISPWSRGGFVNSRVYDHTSVLRFLEKRFGVVETNISPWRRAVMGDLTEAFDFVNPNADTTFVAGLPVADPVTAQVQYEQQTGGTVVAPPAVGAQALPVQATGTRPARALPYACEVVATATADTVRLAFTNAGTAAALFHVYNRLDLDALPRRYTVEAGKALDDTWPVRASSAGVGYDLWVLGPNGFHRLFRGQPETAGLALASRADGAARRLVLAFTAATPGTFTVTPNAFRADGPWDVTLAAGEAREMGFLLAGTNGWYDFTVRGPGGFTRRLAGHLENGQPSISDPAMAEPQSGGALAFVNQQGVPVGTLATSAPVALAGFSGYLPISVPADGTSFSLDGGPFVTSHPAVCAGQALVLRQAAAGSYATARTSQVSVGTTVSSFTVTTASGPRPNAFAFAARTDVPAGRFVVSEAATITGLDGPGPASVSISGPQGASAQYSVNGGAFTSEPGTIGVGDRVAVRQLASAQPGGVVTGTLTVGLYSTAFRTVTDARDHVPDAFDFGTVTDAAPGATVVSAPVTPGGYDTAPISAGQGVGYALDSGPFTSGNGTIARGQAVRVRLTSASTSLGYARGYVTIGGVKGTFTVRTRR